MKIAIIGTGISGLVAAHHLHREHDIRVFEANDHIGGHTNTIDVLSGDRFIPVDTGFIVFNHRTYPNFLALMRELGVAEQTSNMSFSVKCDQTGLEYKGNTLNSLFAQRRNLISPRFHRMVRDILRFNKEAPLLLEQKTKDADVSLIEYLDSRKYSSMFIDKYIVPMGAAIWSAEPEQLIEMPVQFFVQFFHNHGMLQVKDRPQWYVIKGGSREYVKKLIAPFKDKIQVSTPVKEIRRSADHVMIRTDHISERFDHVFVATHSDQALGLLADATPMERRILGSMPYQPNEAVLHTDTSVLPERKLAWAAWNYALTGNGGPVQVTYDMNILQTLDAPETYCVSLNQTNQIREEKIIQTIQYHHPVFTREGLIARRQRDAIDGVNRTSYCGAYWRYGFHEDGVVSALYALERFRAMPREADDAQELHLRRAG